MNTVKPGIVRQGGAKIMYGNEFLALWSLTSICDLKCSYCIVGVPSAHHVNIPMLPWERLKKIADFLISLNKKAYHIHFAGGEPTLFGSRLLQLLDYMTSQLGARFHPVVFTNGMRDIEYYKTLADSVSGLTLLVSIHTEAMALNRLTALINSVAPQCKMRVMLMYNPQRRDYSRAIGRALSDLLAVRKFFPRISKLLDPGNIAQFDPDMTERDFQWVATQNERLAAYGGQLHPGFLDEYAQVYESCFWEFCEEGRASIVFSDLSELLPKAEVSRRNHLKGLWCCLGYNYLQIFEDGTASPAPCGCASAYKSRPLWEADPYREQEYPVKALCPHESCFCSAAHVIPKFHDEKEADAYLAAYKRHDACQSSRVSGIT